MKKALTRAIDATLEGTVVLSFSRVGYAVRSRLGQWGPLPTRRIDRLIAKVERNVRIQRIPGLYSKIPSEANDRLLAQRRPESLGELSGPQFSCGSCRSEIVGNERKYPNQDQGNR